MNPDTETPFGEPPSVPAAATGDGHDAPTAPLSEKDVDKAGPKQILSTQGATTKLDESEAAVPALPVPGEPFPALAVGDTVGGRYRVEQVAQTGPEAQTYTATDLQGYLRCWACGSRDNVKGEAYCTNCGAQLTGKTYRLLETPPNAPPAEIPPPLLENHFPGVAGVFDRCTDKASGRHYLVLEDLAGRPLSELPLEGTQPPGETHLLGLLNSAAQSLQELHAAGIVGCDFAPASLMVLPGDRLVLSDPTACRPAGKAGDKRGPTAEYQADVQRVAAILEQWYTGLHEGGDESTLAAVLAQGREGGYKTAADFAAAIHELLTAALPPHDLQLISGRASDVGMQRELNEDSLFTLECVTMEATGAAPTGIYVVADGMGGHDSGEVASSIAIRTIGGMLSGVIDARIDGGGEPADPDAAGSMLREAILEANKRIAELSSKRHSDMGTTVTMALVVGTRATVANVGDSRTYLWRDGKLAQISRDHSLVARLIASGELTAEEGRHYDRRNEVYRALGDAHLTADEVDIFQVNLRPHDGLLLCSDGLWEMVRDEEIERIMLAAPDLPTAAHLLIAAANRNGGEDNITVIIAQTLTNSEETDA
ncbi:MAG: protein phosphatase 2C domain-containing protein [Chloroflexia bacterium]